MKKSFLIIMLLVCVVLAGCGANTQSAPAEAPAPVEEAAPADAAPADQAAAANVIYPLPVTVDITALDNCSAAVSFEQGDMYVDDSGKLRLKAQVYVYDLFDMVDMSMLKVGDSIVLSGGEVLVESLERSEAGAYIINGGLDMGGYEMFTDESGVFYEKGYNDAYAYYSLGEVTLPVSDEFEFVDASDLDIEPVTYFPGDFLLEEPIFQYHFVPNNTQILILGGEVVQMNRSYIP